MIYVFFPVAVRMRVKYADPLFFLIYICDVTIDSADGLKKMRAFRFLISAAALGVAHANTCTDEEACRRYHAQEFADGEITTDFVTLNYIGHVNGCHKSVTFSGTFIRWNSATTYVEQGLAGGQTPITDCPAEAAEAAEPCDAAAKAACAAANKAACTEGVDSADCGACLTGFNADGDNCVDVCDDAAKTVCTADNKEPCTAGTASAGCGDCLTGFKDEDGVCVDVCDAAAQTACADANKEACLSGSTDCGDCLDGFKADGDGCVPLCQLGGCTAEQLSNAYALKTSNTCEIGGAHTDNTTPCKTAHCSGVEIKDAWDAKLAAATC